MSVYTLANATSLIACVAYMAMIVFRYRDSISKQLSQATYSLRNIASFYRYHVEHLCESTEFLVHRSFDDLSYIWKERIHVRFAFIYSLKGWSFSRYLERALMLGNISYTAYEYRSYMKKSIIFSGIIAVICVTWNFFPFGQFPVLETIAAIRVQYYLPIQALPILVITASLPFLILATKISHRKNAIEDNLPFLALLITIGAMLKTSLIKIFSFIEEKPNVWKEEMKIEANQFLKYASISGEQIAYESYAESQPSEWLRLYLKDLASESKSGGDVRRFTLVKLREAMKNYKERLDKHSSLTEIIITASLCFITMLPTIVLTLMILFASMREIEQITSLLNIFIMLLIAYPILGLFGLAFKPYLSITLKAQTAPLLTSVACCTATILMSYLYLSPITAIYLILLSLSAPFCIYYIWMDKVNSRWLEDVDRFLLDVLNGVKIGRSIQSIIKTLPRKYSRSFNQFLDAFVTRFNHLGMREAFKYSCNAPLNDDVKKIFSSMEFAALSGTEEPEVFSILCDSFSEFRSSITSHKQKMMLPMIIVYLGSFTLFFTLHMMLKTMGGIPTFAFLGSYLPMIFMLLPFTLFEGGYIEDLIVTGSPIGAFRNGFFNLLFGFILASFFGFL